MEGKWVGGVKLSGGGLGEGDRNRKDGVGSWRSGIYMGWKWDAGTRVMRLRL
jgi:hypothetical protein